MNETCAWCDELIEDEADCRALPSWPSPRLIYEHRACFLRSIMGSVAHQRGECSCYGGTGEDDPSLSRRQAAQAAVDYFNQKWH